MHECQFGRRLQQVVPDAPTRWEFATTAEAQELAVPLRGSVEQLLGYLDRIDTIEAFLALDWLTVDSELGLLAQLQYLLGHRREAVAAMAEMSAFFGSRPAWNLERTLERSGLTSLAPDLVLQS